MPSGILPEVMPMGRTTRHSGSRMHWKEISEPCLVADLDAIWRTARIVADGTLAAQDAIFPAVDDWAIKVNVGWHPKKKLDL